MASNTEEKEEAMTQTLTVTGGNPLRGLAMPLLLAFAFVLGGCTMDETSQRTGSGALIGAGAGAAGGALLGGGKGAAIGAVGGAVVGGATGYIVDRNKKKDEAEKEAERLRWENEQLRRQQQQQQQQQP